MFVEIKFIPYSKIENIKDKYIDIYYEDGMKICEFWIDDVPVGFIVTMEKNNIINMRNLYIYNQERHKHLMKPLVCACYIFVKEVYPTAKIIWWSTKFDNEITNKYSTEVHLNKFIETKNPNVFGFDTQDQEPNYLYWSYTDELYKKYKKEMSEIEIQYEI